MTSSKSSGEYYTLAMIAFVAVFQAEHRRPRLF